ncbi:MAG: hypothetical protein HND53_12790 [Proteobacteria bacterium]|nr:hypothetical protein [Pseudomonadota bacterium]NOG61373.1 hypothetical protein [Pseudomonadota bacterium]
MYDFFKIVLIFLLAIQSASSDVEPLTEQAVHSSLAEKSLLLASDQYGSLSVVAGERGHILFSENNIDWTQAVVETKAALTNVFMLDEKTGWAVGHDAIILKSTDGARTWKKVFSDIKEEAPLLDIFFKDALNGIAVGAYSLIYVTSDGGSSWERAELNLAKNNEDKELSEFSDIFDFHLNVIAFAGDRRFYIAAEAGHILRSDDEVISWIDLPSPYQGSYFGVLPLSFNEVIVYGLRGHLYRSMDAGQSWERINTDSNQMLTDAILLSNGNIIVVGLAGTLLLSEDKGKSFSRINLQHRHGLSAVLQLEDGSILLTGDAGIQILTEDSLVNQD